MTDELNEHSSAGSMTSGPTVDELMRSPMIGVPPSSYFHQQPRPATWQEELSERYIPNAGPPCDRTEHYILLEVKQPDATSHFYRFSIREPDGTIGEYQGLDRTCVFSILRGLERAWRHGAKAGGEWSWLEFLRKVVGPERSET